MIRWTFLLISLGFGSYAQLVLIEESQVLMLNGREHLTGLFDERDELIDGSGRPVQNPTKPFHATYNKLYSPQEFLVDLKGYYRIDSIAFFDGPGRDSLEILIGSPGAWKTLSKLYTNSYNTWRQQSCFGNGGYLLLRFKGQAEIGELLIYGRGINGRIRAPLAKVEHASPSFGEFIGINAFVDDPGEKVAAVSSLVREYHNWEWHYPEGLKQDQILAEGIRFAPATAGAWDFDAYYSDLQSRNLKVYPCIQGSLKCLAEEFDHKALNPNFAADDPMAYRMHSAFVWQYVARYGAQTQEEHDLNLAVGQKRISGLNLLAGIEVWNEPDKWWRGRAGYFHPFEYAAFLSADYDGHNGRLGALHGAKNADPQMPVLMGGIAGLDTNYIEAIRIWSLYNRSDARFPADVLNFHHYSNDAGGQDDRANYGISPEDDRLMQRLQALVSYRNRVLPEQKIFLSEFGYDSNPKSIQAPAPEDSLAVLEAQANYLLRSLLLAHASGIDGAFVYMLRDVNAPNPNKYMSSGLTAEKWNHHQPKPAFYKLRGLKKILGDYQFEAREQEFLKELYIFRYRHPITGARAYVLWTKSLDRKSHFKSPYFLSEDGIPQVYTLPNDQSEIQGELLSTTGIWVNNSPIILIYE